LPRYELVGWRELLISRVLLRPSDRAVPEHRSSGGQDRVAIRVHGRGSRERDGPEQIGNRDPISESLSTRGAGRVRYSGECWGFVQCRTILAENCMAMWRHIVPVTASLPSAGYGVSARRGIRRSVSSYRAYRRRASGWVHSASVSLGPAFATSWRLHTYLWRAQQGRSEGS
jgi:hypothetical protein